MKVKLIIVGVLFGSIVIGGLLFYTLYILLAI